MRKGTRFQIVNQNGEVRSNHRTYEGALKKHNKHLNWNKKEKCCSAEHYNDKIIQIA